MPVRRDVAMPDRAFLTGGYKTVNLLQRSDGTPPPPRLVCNLDTMPRLSKKEKDMKTTLIGTALIAALLAGAASASSELGDAQTVAQAAAESVALSDAAKQPGDMVTIPGTNMYYIHDVTNAPAGEAAPVTPSQGLARIMN